jgi:agmatine deiminase
MAHNKAMLEEIGVEVTAIEMLPRTTREGTDEPIVVPYTNFYVCNGAVVVPIAGLDPHMDEDALKLIGSLYPGREVVGVEALTLALGGGGVHCITQQVPA